MKSSSALCCSLAARRVHGGCGIDRSRRGARSGSEKRRSTRAGARAGPEATSSPGTGEQIAYHLYVPMKWTPSMQLPLVIVTHGAAQPAAAPFQRPVANPTLAQDGRGARLHRCGGDGISRECHGRGWLECALQDDDVASPCGSGFRTGVLTGATDHAGLRARRAGRALRHRSGGQGVQRPIRNAPI